MNNTREMSSWTLGAKERPSIRGGAAMEQGSSRLVAGQVKVGEVLTKEYDLSAVDPEDRSSVMATIQCIVTLEDQVPELEITVTRESGYYAILVRGFDEFIDIVGWHHKVRSVTGGSNNKMRLVRNFLSDSATGILTVRVGMRQTGMVNEPGLPALPMMMMAAAGSSSKKRERDEEPTDASAPAPVDYELAKRILDSLRDRCNMDDADPADVHRLLTVLYHATMLDREVPLLEVSPVRRDDSGAYVMTCRGFISQVDFDQIYDRFVSKAHSDDALRTLLSVAYNPAQGMLELQIQGGRPAGPGKRRRAGPGDGL
jgi:hypothetical protein